MKILMYAALSAVATLILILAVIGSFFLLEYKPAQKLPKCIHCVWVSV